MAGKFLERWGFRSPFPFFDWMKPIWVWIAKACRERLQAKSACRESGQRSPLLFCQKHAGGGKFRVRVGVENGAPPGETGCCVFVCATVSGACKSYSTLPKVALGKKQRLKSTREEEEGDGKMPSKHSTVPGGEGARKGLFCSVPFSPTVENKQTKKKQIQLSTRRNKGKTLTTT